MKIVIKSRFGEKILFEGEYESTKYAVIDAVSKKAYLRGAYLRGDKEQPELVLTENGILQQGPIGSRRDYLVSYLTTDAGIYIKAGCFFGSLAKFTKKVNEVHSESTYAHEYKAAIAMINAVFKTRKGK